MSVTAIPTAMLEHLPQEMQNFQPMAVICNILPQEVHPIIQTYGVYHINYPKQGQRYALTQIKWAALYMDKGDSVFNLMGGQKNPNRSEINDNRIRTLQGAREIAEDLCQQMNQSDGPTAFWGKFVCKGLEPTEEELVAAEQRLNEYFTHVVDVADRIWSASPRHDLIDSRCKIAAKHLKIGDREWLVTVRQMQDCPACMEPIRIGAVICRHCHTVIDSAQAEKIGLSREPEEEVTAPAAKRERKKQRVELPTI